MLMRFIPLLAILTSACTQTITYDTAFETVTVKKDKVAVSEATFKDKLVTIKAVHNKDMDVWITNNSDDKIKIIWDDCLFVDPFGKQHKIVHVGVRYIAKNESQPPTTILPGVTLEEILASGDSIYYANGWKNEGLILSEVESAPPAKGPREKVRTHKEYAEEIAQQYVGKDMRILLVIEDSNQKRHDYYLQFKVKGYKIESGGIL